MILTKVVIKKCPKCNKSFNIERKIDNDGNEIIKKKERKHCSRKCANSHIQTKEMNEKRRQKLNKKILHNCLFCNKEFFGLLRKRYCSISCASKIDRKPYKRHPVSQQTKIKLRLAMIKHKEKFLGIKNFSPNIGKKEKIILDDIELKENIKIERQVQFLGYFVDGYCKETNIVYEVDEFYVHKKKKERDIIRQKEIEKHLFCKFIRITI